MKAKSGHIPPMLRTFPWLLSPLRVKWIAAQDFSEWKWDLPWGAEWNLQTTPPPRTTCSFTLCQVPTLTLYVTVTLYLYCFFVVLRQVLCSSVMEINYYVDHVGLKLCLPLPPGCINNVSVLYFLPSSARTFFRFRFYFLRQGFLVDLAVLELRDLWYEPCLALFYSLL